MNLTKTKSKLDVSYLGPEGTYTHLATTKYFSSGVKLAPCSSIRKVFDSVTEGITNFGVVPVENSYIGSVSLTLHMLMSSSLLICGEVEIPIHHNLLSKADSLSDIDSVFAHPQALDQCSLWLEKNLSEANANQALSNADAAKKTLENKSAAAIASKFAANIYNLNILAERIEDHYENATRFLVLGNDNVRESESDKTSLLFSASDTKGAGVLYDLLNPLSKNNISMTRIQSLPSKTKKWDYIFFVDIEGHSKNKIVKEALLEIKSKATLFKILGSYKKSE
ncbi:MAG: hypothetical protein CBC38_06030 [Gammaproteobacteria bacterium TMED78]|nr:MAG: hypothetical protein CBC38_06030 [Gammaproteobacteria bacterium TMED78]|tara:strand:- start:17272 stop:18114 length:843 start_codon:yes stop_codon:yes gene_type:complete